MNIDISYLSVQLGWLNKSSINDEDLWLIQKSLNNKTRPELIGNNLLGTIAIYV